MGGIILSHGAGFGLAGLLLFCAAGGSPGKAPSDRVIAGVVIEGGVTCPLFRTDEGEVFALASVAKAEAPVGTRLRLRGQEDRFSFCMQGRAFSVRERLD